MRRVAIALAWLAVAPAGAAAAPAPQLPVEELTLANGLRFLLLPRPGSGTVAAGWAVRVGTADEPEGGSGVAHVVEHMLFQGTRTIATRDIEAELALLAREDSLHAEIARLEAETAAAPPAGGRLARMRSRIGELRRELATLVTRLRELTFPGEFALRYSEAGGTGLNANTAQDLTLYYVTLPAERLELWFWLESDRLLDPVFREFEREKDVIAEERRLRVEATPTGAVEEELARRFWGDGPYGRPTLGLADEVAGLSRQQVRAFFDAGYVPRQIVAALVGDFDPQRVRAWAELYFGRLPDRAPATAPAAAPASPPDGETRWSAACDCPRQARLLHRTVPLGHRDTDALQLLAGLLNGRSGRLYRALVVERGLAFAAFAQQTPYARTGAFEVTLEAKGDATAAALVTAWDDELAALVAAPIPAAELERARNTLAAEALRQLRDPSQLMRRLLIYEALGGWRHLADWTERLRRLEEAQVREAARRYLRPENRFVALIERAGEGR